MKNALTLTLCLCLLTFNVVAQEVQPDDRAGRNYQEYCANCHGDKFQGGNAQSLIDGIWQFGGARNYMFRNIKFGIQHLGMPSYAASLSDDDIHALVTFLLEQEKKAGAKRPPMPAFIEAQDYVMNVEVIAEGLEIPWSVDFFKRTNNFDHGASWPGSGS